jgi:hypothetical protein
VDKFKGLVQSPLGFSERTEGEQNRCRGQLHE